MSITVVGCITFDTIDLPGGEQRRSLGGSALYAALAASISTETHVVTAVGIDCPDATLAFAGERGIDLSRVQRIDGRTPRWHGEYWGAGLQDRRTVSLDEGVMAELTLETVDIGSGDILYLATAHPKHQLDAVAQGGYRLLALDTIDVYLPEFRSQLLNLLPEVDLLFLNESEANALAGRGAIDEAAEELLARGAGLVCIKRADEGARLFAADYALSCPAFVSSPVIDPTGAGDGFAGAFLGYLDANGGDHTDRGRCQEALVFATAVASSVIAAPGPAGLLAITAEQIAARTEAISVRVDRTARRV
jgi:sugar/nucleoside kinase (ribokinase family)